MVYAKINTGKADLEYSKWRLHRCALFVIYKTWMKSTGTEMKSPADNSFRIMLIISIRTKN